jgi:hypothetical protein
LPFLPLLHFVVWGVLLSSREFKPVCAARELDISRYGWQKRQDRGKKRQRGGKVGSEIGNVWQG